MQPKSIVPMFATTHSSAFDDEGGWRAAVAGRDTMLIDSDLVDSSAFHQSTSTADTTLSFEALFPETDLNSLLTIDDHDHATTPFTSPRESVLGSPEELLLTPHSANTTSPILADPSPLLGYLDAMGDLPSLFVSEQHHHQHSDKPYLHSISPADTRLPVAPHGGNAKEEDAPQHALPTSRTAALAGGNTSINSTGVTRPTLTSTSSRSSTMSQSPAPTSPSSSSTRTRSSSGRATGFRTNVALIPIDAPTQPRNYLGPSATSRKNLEAVAAALVSSGATLGNGVRGRKRTRAVAGLKLEGENGEGSSGARRSKTNNTISVADGEEEDELAADSSPPHSTATATTMLTPLTTTLLPSPILVPNPEGAKASLLEKLEDKRRKNALSARKSRMLKKETKEMLEGEVERLKGLLTDMGRERDYWKRVAAELGATTTTASAEGCSGSSAGDEEED